MTSSNGNNFRVTGPLCEEFTGHQWIPPTKAIDAKLWCFLWSAPEWMIETPSRSLWRKCNETSSIPWQLMPWLLVTKGHQQARHWLHKISQPLSSMGKDLNSGIILCIHAPSQWETTLQCNVASHSLCTCTEWSLKLPPPSQCWQMTKNANKIISMG